MAQDDRGVYGSRTGANLARTALAELAGTAILVFAGTSVAVAAILGRTTAGGPIVGARASAFLQDRFEGEGEGPGSAS